MTVAPRPLVLERDASGKLTRAAWSDGWEVTLREDGTYRGNCDVAVVLRGVEAMIQGWEGN